MQLGQLGGAFLTDIGPGWTAIRDGLICGISSSDWLGSVIEEDGLPMLWSCRVQYTHMAPLTRSYNGAFNPSYTSIASVGERHHHYSLYHHRRTVRSKVLW